MNGSSETCKQRHAGVFSNAWPVYEAYDIVGDVLQPRGGVMQTYAPILHQELPQEFARLARGDGAGVQHFAQTYGLLGYGPLTAQPLTGDPLLWIWMHVDTVALCLQLTHLLRIQAIDSLRETLYALRVPAQIDDEAFLLWPAVQAAHLDRCNIVQWAGKAERTREDTGKWKTSIDALSKESLQEESMVVFLARKIRRDLINQNMVRVYRELVENEGHEQDGFRFHALIEVVYWHLADVVMHRAVMPCADCGKLFVQTHARQQFCPPRHRQKESPCAVRKRVKKYLTKARQM